MSAGEWSHRAPRVARVAVPATLSRRNFGEEAVMSADPIEIVHFSDILCVWAYVAQRRMDELIAEFGDQVHVTRRFSNVFGDTHAKIDRGWSDRGGYAGYAAHVREVVARFPELDVHPELWTHSIPRSSLSAHLFARAAELVRPGSLSDVSHALRRAFFLEARDVSYRGVQLEIASELGLDAASLAAVIDDGSAHAALATDLDLAVRSGVKMSPCVVLDGGRQTLNGNVGYRVLAANVRELAERPADTASWC